MVARELVTHLFTPVLEGRGGSSAPLIISGSAHPGLGNHIAANLGWPLGDASLGSFLDGEIQIKLNEPASGSHAFVIQPMNSAQAILELFLLVDTLKRSSASRVTAVIPYFGYARQDRRTGLEPNSAALMARQLETAGADQVILLDIHNPAIEGFFRFPVVSLIPVAPFIAAWRAAGLDLNSLTLAAPDVGGVKRAEVYRRAIGAGANLAFLHKLRGVEGDVKINGIAGEVAGRTVMVVDDILSSGATLLKAVETLVEHGAAAVYATVTHLVTAQVLSDLSKSPITKLFVSDSLPCPATHEKLSIVSIAPLLAEAVANLFPQ